MTEKDEKKVAAKGEEKTETKAEEVVAGKAKKAKKLKRKHVPVANAHIYASYNNTIVTLSDLEGNTIAWASAGGSGFKGARKSTPYASQVAAENAGEKAKAFGVEKVHVYVKGVGNGREQAIRGLTSKGFDLLSINDVTPTAHNGCRKKKARRV